MSKKVILVHGWGGNPERDWIQWLRKELESKGFEVIAPQMPDTMHPKIEAWISKLKEVVGKVDKQTYFIGHSIGCQAIMRYLQALGEKEKVGGVIFVAGWFNLKAETWDDDYTREIAKPWLETPLDFGKIKEKTKKFVVILSDNDPYVPLSDSEIFKEKLGAKIIIEKNKGHISGEDGVNESPVILKKILEMMR